MFHQIILMCAFWNVFLWFKCFIRSITALKQKQECYQLKNIEQTNQILFYLQQKTHLDSVFLVDTFSRSTQNNQSDQNDDDKLCVCRLFGFQSLIQFNIQ